MAKNLYLSFFLEKKISHQSQLHQFMHAVHAVSVHLHTSCAAVQTCARVDCSVQLERPAPHLAQQPVLHRTSPLGDPLLLLETQIIRTTFGVIGQCTRTTFCVICSSSSRPARCSLARLWCPRCGSRGVRRSYLVNDGQGIHGSGIV
jgi:hypothetical protein